MNNTPDEIQVLKSRAFKKLNAVQWMNIVNFSHAYEGFSKEEAVHAAVRMTEQKLMEINTHE
jgi:hypothetical protein